MFLLRESEKVVGVRFVRFEGKPSDEELATYLDYERALLSRRIGETRILVVGVGEAWTSEQRRKMRDFETEAIARTGRTPPGMVMVVKNSLIRGAITAYYWLAPATYPVKMVEKAEDACDWVLERLSQCRAPAPTREAFLREARMPWPARRAIPGVGLVGTSDESLENVS